jgi:membrane protein DedA with SNARE-associated domain
MVIEGPIITIICGFLAYLGFLNIFVAYPVLVCGDLIGDSVYYTIGKYSNKYSWMHKAKNHLGYTDESAVFIKNHFEKHTAKTLLISKMSHGLGIPVQISAGISGVKFPTYISIELIGTMLKTLALLFIGFYLGDSYQKINSYLQFIALVAIGIMICTFLYVMYKKYLKNYLR